MSESESESGGVGRREVAYRMFAAEFDDSDFSYSESDEERAPNYVVTPTGARVNRLFVVGVLTELEQVNEEVLRARVVDPTGAFVVYAGQYQPEALAFLEAADPPLFVAVTGKARTFEPEDGDRVYTSIRPESISEVDADTRDRWVVQAAEQTVERVARMASAKQTGLSGEQLHAALTDDGVQESQAAGITLALDHYGTTGDYLDAVRESALDAARVVAGEIDEVESLSIAPGSGGDDRIPVLADTEFDADVATPATSADAGTGAETATAAESGTAADSSPVSAQAAGESEPDQPGGETDEAVSASAESSTVDDAGGDTETSELASTGDSRSTAEAETSDASDQPDSPADPDDEIGDFEPEFELDDDEREQIESEYGTDFQSGTEVDDPGEAGIETPDPEELDEAAAEQRGAPAGAADADSAPGSSGAPGESESVDPDADAATSDAPAETPETATDAGADETAGTAGDEPESGTDADETTAAAETSTEPADDVDLEDAVMDEMKALDDGDGADREELLAAVVERTGADPDAVEDAIQDALMGGRCYEPEDGKLMSI